MTNSLPKINALIVACALSGCGVMSKEIQQEEAATVEVTMSIKAKLVESELVDGAAILVELVDEVVVISGFVASEKEAAEVIRIAKLHANGYTTSEQLEVK